MKATSKNNIDYINSNVNCYNADATSAYMKAILGEEGWERHKPTKNIKDFLTRRANDNRVAV